MQRNQVFPPRNAVRSTFFALNKWTACMISVVSSASYMCPYVRGRGQVLRVGRGEWRVSTRSLCIALHANTDHLTNNHPHKSIRISYVWSYVKPILPNKKNIYRSDSCLFFFLFSWTGFHVILRGVIYLLFTVGRLLYSLTVLNITGNCGQLKLLKWLLCFTIKITATGNQFFYPHILCIGLDAL